MGKGGFKKLSFEEAFPLSSQLEEAIAHLSAASTDSERAHWSGTVQALGNRITPACRQAAASFHSAIAKEAIVWAKQHGGISNIADFIRHIQALDSVSRVRRKSGKVVPIQPDTVRKVLRKIGVQGQRGRPRKLG
jgi:glycerol-3-phosphate O-acyltransferase